MCLGVFKRQTDCEQLQKGVEGYFEEFPKKHLVVHPMFCEDNARWRLASRLLAIASKVYVNEDGARKCSVNGGTVVTNAQLRAGGCPHLFGNVVFVVKQSEMTKAGLTHFPLVLVENFEPETDEASEAKKKECAEKGYEYYEGAGQVFLRPCV